MTANNRQELEDILRVIQLCDLTAEEVASKWRHDMIEKISELDEQYNLARKLLEEFDLYTLKLENRRLRRDGRRP